MDGEPTYQTTPSNGGQPAEPKQDIFTTLAIRLVLDKAGTVSEATEILEKYNMFATGTKDYHFYITDKTGASVVVEYDYKDVGRRCVISNANIVTNFYLFNGSNYYGHGHDRYVAVQKTLEYASPVIEETLWDALKNSAQEPVEGDVTSNTQWSIVFNNIEPVAHIAIRRKWDDKHVFVLSTIDKHFNDLS